MAFIKHAPADHPQATMVEAAGLRWLAQAADDGGASVVPLVSASPGAGSGAGATAGSDAGAYAGAGADAGVGELVLEELARAAPDAAAAQRFGAALARTHSWLASRPGGSVGSGNPENQVGFGMLPPEHPAHTPAYFGPAEQPLAMGTGVHSSWGAFIAAERLDPVLEALQVSLPGEDARLLRAARDKIGSGILDDSEPPALIHGDLWAGNVLWTPTEAGEVEAVLIDPAAHAGHRETDIALLHLFGLPQLDSVIQGYQSEHPLRGRWQDRIPLHQFFCLAVHWLLFGQSYRGPTLGAADAVLKL